MAFGLFKKLKKNSIGAVAMKTESVTENTEVNRYNSYGSVRCVADGTCGHRFTEMCKKCINNIGPEEFKSYFVERAECTAE